MIVKQTKYQLNVKLCIRLALELVLYIQLIKTHEIIYRILSKEFVNYEIYTEW